MVNFRPRLEAIAVASATIAALICAGQHVLPPSKVHTAPSISGNSLALRAANTQRAVSDANSSVPTPARVRSLRAPLAFEPVAGKSSSPGAFLARGSGYTVLVTPDEAALSLRKGSQRSKNKSQRAKVANRLQAAADIELRKTAGSLHPLLQSPIAGLQYGASTGAENQVQPVTTGPPEVLRVKFLGASQSAKVVGMEKLPGKSNYFIGRDPKKWRTNVPHYARVKIKEVYPGVDVVYYGNQGQLEYDFLLAPGADPAAITLALAPVSSPGTVAAMSPSPSGSQRPPLQIDANGDLVIASDAGEVRFHKPLVYQGRKPGLRSQEPEGKPGTSNDGQSPTDAFNRQSTIENRQFLDGRYVLTADNHVRFEIPPYDKSRPLVIDPVLVYSSYLGGSGADYAQAVAVDSAGNIFVAGGTQSADFPTTSGSYQPSANFGCSIQGCNHGFITKFDLSGASLIYSTYLGGSGSDNAGSVAVDSSGNVFVAGNSNSTDFPLINPTPTNYTSGSCGGFVGELSADGDQLLYSSCFAQSSVAGIVVDSAGNVYLTGDAGAANFPVTPGAFQTTYNGVGEIFVSKLHPNGSPLIASTFIGGTEYVGTNAIAVDSTGSPYVTGITSGTTFPTTPGAFDTTPAAGCNTVVAKLAPDLSTLAYSTYLCADNYYPGLAGIAVDPSGAAYVAGTVTKPIFPATPGAFQTALSGTEDAFLAKFDPSGSTLAYGTYLGSANGEVAGYRLAVDSAGQAYVVANGGGPTASPFQPSCPGSGCAFVAVINSSGSALVYSTYLGGSGSQVGNASYSDGGYAIALTPSGNVALVGFTGSYDFPLVKPLQGTYGGAGDAFLAVISPINAPGATLRPTSVSFPNQNVNTTSAAEFATLMNVGSQPLVITSIAATGDFTETNTCPSTIAVGGNCPVKITFSPTTPGKLTGSLVVTDNALDSPQSFTLSGTSLGAAASTSPASIAFPNQFVGTTGLPQDVTLMNTGTIPLTITAVQATGDFAAVNGCTSSVAPAVNCTIGVFFDPSATGNRTGTLTIADNAPDSPQTIALSGTGEDFSMALQTSSPTAPAGQEVLVPLTLTPAGGFNVPVVLTCTGTPALSTCNVNPSSAAMDGKSAVKVNVTIQTTASSGSPGRPQFPLPMGRERTVILGAGLLLLCLTLAAGKRRRLLLVRLSLASMLLLTLFWTDCGGTATTVTPSGPRTPAGKYTLAVTGIAASGPATLSHTVPLNLTVQ